MQNDLENAHFTCPTSHGAKSCPWGHAEEAQFILGVAALHAGEDGFGLCSPCSPHIMVLLGLVFLSPVMSHHHHPTCLPQVPGIQFIFYQSGYSSLSL